MNIWLLKTGEPLPIQGHIKKMRTALLADRLTERGHSVVWWAGTVDHLTKEVLFDRDTDVAVQPGLVIKVLAARPYRKNASPQRYLYHHSIAAKFRRLAPGLPRPDVILASTPDHLLAYAGYCTARHLSVPFILDIRDAWPDSFLEVLPKWVVPLARLALWDDFRRLRATLRGADSLVASMGSLLEWGLRHAGRPATGRDRVFYLGSAPITAPSPSASGEFAALLERLSGEFVVTYIGTFGIYNNPSILIQAARQIDQRLGDEGSCVFVVGGDGMLRPQVLAEADGLHNVLFPGWLSGEQMAQLLAASSIGVIPWRQGDAFPNKAFDYLRAGLPIITSAGGDLQDLLAQEQIGFYFPPNDEHHLAEAIERMRSDPQLRASMAERARRVFAEQLNADVIYNAYADHVEAMARVLS